MAHKNKKHYKKGRPKQSGGTPDQQFLLIADTFHDFWNCNRGRFKGNNVWTQLFNYKLLQLLNPLTDIYAYGFDERITAGGQVKYLVQSTNLTSYGNEIFGRMSDGHVHVTNVTDETAVYMNIGLREGESDFPVLWKMPSVSGTYVNHEDFEDVCRTVFGIQDGGELPDQIYLICDMGPGIFGNLGKGHPRLGLIITPQTIGDSAPTGFDNIGGIPNVIISPVNQDDRTFLSDANMYSTFDTGYRIRYNGQINEFNPYNFTYNVQGQMTDGNYYNQSVQYGGGITRGPSAGQLGGCYLAKTLPQQVIVNEPLTIPPDNPNRQVNVINSIVTDLNSDGNRFRAVTTELNAWTNFGNFVDSRILLDMKRAGDRDQVVMASLLSYVCPNIIFVTGDVLCAAQAVKKGLPTVYYNNSSKEVRYWERNYFKNQNEVQSESENINLEGGGASTPSYSKNINKQSTKPVTKYDITDEESLNYEPVSIDGFLADVCSIVAANINSAVSKSFVELNQLASLYRIITSLTNLEKFKTPLNKFSFFEVNSAIQNYNSLVKINTSKELKEIKEPAEFNSQVFSKKVTILIESLKEKINNMSDKRASVKQQLLKTNFNYVSDDLKNYIGLKYSPNKKGFLINEDAKDVYNYVIKVVTETKDQARFNNSLISLALLNTVIQYKVGLITSPIAILINGYKPLFANTPRLTENTITIYQDSLKNLVDTINNMNKAVKVNKRVSIMNKTRKVNRNRVSIAV